MDIGVYIQAFQLAQAYADLREQYNSLLLIANDNNVDEKIRYEAIELTKNGYDGFIRKVMQLVEEPDE